MSRSNGQKVGLRREVNYSHTEYTETLKKECLDKKDYIKVSIV
jgi:hypothetical protein